MSDGKAVVLSGEWLSLEETLATLGIARRTLQSWTKKGKLRSKRLPLDGRKPAPAYHAQDVARVKRAMEENPRPPSPAAVAARPKTELAKREPSLEIERARAALDEKRLDFARERWALEREERRLRTLHQKAWLTPAECARGWGLPGKTVIELAEGGALAGLRCGRSWRIRRASLEAFAG